MPRTIGALACLFVLLGAARFEPSVSAQRSEPLWIVAGVGFPSDDIGLGDLRSVFRGQYSALGGKRIVPINQPIGTPLRILFDRTVLGLEPAQVGPFWVDRRIRDEGSPPTVAPSVELSLRAVARLNGSITYCTARALASNIKVLKIDGRRPGHPGYALVP